MGGSVRVIAVTALVVLAAAACARRREFIGTIIGMAGAGGDGGSSDADGAGPPPDSAGAMCPPDKTPGPVEVPRWTCGPDCYHDPVVNRAPFDNAEADDPTRNPTIVYPLPGSVHPLNLPKLTVMWQRAAGAGQTAFLVTLSSLQRPGRLFRFFVPHALPASDLSPPVLEDSAFEVPTAFWKYVARELAGTTASLVVTAYDPSINRLARSLPVDIRFTNAPVEGQLHYVQVLEPAGIRRASLDSDTSGFLIPARSPANPHDCAGCHSLSADGGRIAFAATYAGNLTVSDTANPGAPLLPPPPPPTNVSDAVAPALSPNGQLVLARSGVPGDDTVTLRNPQGLVLDTRTREQMGGRIDYPAWSPRGTELVAGRSTNAQQPAKPYLALDGHLVTIPVTGNKIDTPVVLHQENDQMFAYPAFSPDGAWIVFVSRKAGVTSEDADSELRLLERASGKVTPLGTSLRPSRATTWPRFAPAPQDDCRKLYLVFQSRLDYGLVLDNDRLNDKRAQLWLAEIDLRKLEAIPAGDPLSAPVWLPLQDHRNKNILPVFSR